MSSLRAASTRLVPAGTSTLRPSMVSSAMGRHRLHPLLELAAEVLHRGRQRTGERLGEDADRARLAAAHDLVEHREVARLALAALEAGDQLVGPGGALAARAALPARLVAEEAG